MQVFLHNDDTLHGFASGQAFAEDVLGRELKGRMAGMLTRVDVWVSDENGPKGGPDHKKCAMEAHPRGRRPVGVHANAADIPAAIRGAGKKLARALERELKLDR